VELVCHVAGMLILCCQSLTPTESGRISRTTGKAEHISTNSRHDVGICSMETTPRIACSTPLAAMLVRKHFRRSFLWQRYMFALHSMLMLASLKEAMTLSPDSTVPAFTSITSAFYIRRRASPRSINAILVNIEDTF
jgi:hypothetical protein